MTLRDLFNVDSDADVSALTMDSRTVVPGSVFFCVDGRTTDGHQYAAQAAEKGAVCIVHEKELDSYCEPVHYIRTGDVHAAMGRAADRFYHHPSRDLILYGVTGTNGKTTVASLISELSAAARPTGYIGTIENPYNPARDGQPHTTPDVLRLNSMLAHMRDDGLMAAAMEVSSHGLVQRRVEGISFDVAVMTNLTHEHLDYHGTLEAYLDAKALLFKNLDPDAVAVLNLDDSSWTHLLGVTKARIVTYSLNGTADYRAQDLELRPGHSRFTLLCDGNTYRVETNLEGRFNISNLLAALAAVHETGVPLEDLLPVAQRFSQIKGRMERIDRGQPFHVLVDYAHTPDGFDKVFSAVKALHGDAPITAVFSSPGKRDKSKRPDMGRAADLHCARIILTEGDHRDEEPEAIAAEIQKGIRKTPVHFERYRIDAIRKALTEAEPNSVVLILTKGDEPFLDRYGTVIDWMGDVNAAQSVLAELGYSD